MPVYDFKCLECNFKFDDYLKTHKEDNPLCPNCSGETKRLLSTTLIDMDGLTRSTPSQKATKESNGARLV